MFTLIPYLVWLWGVPGAFPKCLYTSLPLRGPVCKEDMCFNNLELKPSKYQQLSNSFRKMRKLLLTRIRFTLNLFSTESILALHTRTRQQNGALSSRCSEGQLVKGHDLSTSLQDPVASTVGHL